MSHSSNIAGTILLLFGLALSGAGAGAATFGYMDGYAAEQQFPRDEERQEIDRMLLSYGGVALTLGVMLSIVAFFLLARKVVHEGERREGMIVTRKTFGILFLIMGLMLSLAGTAAFVTAMELESQQGTGFQYDHEDGEEHTLIGTAGAVFAVVGFGILATAIIMLAKRDEHQIQEAASEAVADPVVAGAFKEDAKTNKTAAIILVAMLAFGMLMLAIFLSASTSEGGFFDDSPQATFSVFSHSMTNTGNAPLIGTIGNAWIETIPLAGGQEMEISYTKSVDNVFTYTVEENIDGMWKEIRTSTVTEKEATMAYTVHENATHIRFIIEPSVTFVQEAELSAVVAY